MAFREIEVQSRQLDKGWPTEATKLRGKIKKFSNEHPITVIDIDGDNKNIVEYLNTKLKETNIKSTDLTNASLKLAIDHDVAYYVEKTMTDPYHPSCDTQHITVENIEKLSIKSLKATLYSSIKELMIKNDLKKHQISLVEDQQLPTQFSFFQKFKQDDNDIVLQFKFLPDNHFEIKKVENEDFDNNPFVNLSDEEVRSIELIVEDEANNSYFKIEKTGKNTLPNKEFYEDMIEYTNHDKTPTLGKRDLLKASKSLKDKKYDPFIQLIELDQQDQYSASEVIKMLNETNISPQTQSKLAAVLTQKYHFIILINSKRKWARERYFVGLTDINYFQNRNSIYYNVGVIGNGMRSEITRGSVVRKISPIDLLNDEVGLSSKDIFDLIDTMLVTFVKYTDLTVLPFPEKYLNEYYRLFVKNSGE